MADSNVQLIQDPNDPNNQKGTSGTGAAPSAATPAAAPTDPGAGSAPVSSASGSSSGSSGATASGSTGQTGGAKAGTGFVNIQNVLNANKGTGQTLGNIVGAGIQQASSDVGQGLGTAQNTFGAAATAGAVGNSADIANRNAILNSISGYVAPPTSTTPAVNTVGSGPTSPNSPVAITGTALPTTTVTPGASSTAPTTSSTTGTTVQAPTATTSPSTSPITPLLTGNAPTIATQSPDFGTTATPLAAGLTQQNLTDWSNYTNAGANTGTAEQAAIAASQPTMDTLQQQATAAQQMGQNVGTAGGQQALLQQFIDQGNGNYTTGDQSLDQLLMGQGGMGALQQAQNSTTNLPGNITQAETGMANQAAYNTANANQFGTNTVNDLANASTPITNAITAAQAAAAANDTTVANNAAALQAIFNPATSAAAATTTVGTPMSTAAPGSVSAGGIALPTSAGGPQGGVVAPGTTTPSAGASAIQQLLSQGLLTSDQAAQLDTLYNQGFIDPSNQTTSTGPSALNPTYTSLGALGLNTAQLMGSDFTNTAGNAASIGNAGFISPTQAAQMNALAQLGGQQYNPLTQNMPTYTAGTNTFNGANLLNQIQNAETAYEQAPTAAAYQQAINAPSAGGLGGFLTNTAAGAALGGGGLTDGATYLAGKFDPNLAGQLNTGLTAALTNGLSFIPGAQNVITNAGNAISNIFSGWSDGGIIPTKEEQYSRVAKMLKKKSK
jgi:hypothetical protein